LIAPLDIDQWRGRRRLECVIQQQGGHIEKHFDVSPDFDSGIILKFGPIFGKRRTKNRVIFMGHPVHLFWFLGASLQTTPGLCL